MFYAIYMETRPRACACILHKTLSLMLYLLLNSPSHAIYLLLNSPSHAIYLLLNSPSHAIYLLLDCVYFTPHSVMVMGLWCLRIRAVTLEIGSMGSDMARENM